MAKTTITKTFYHDGYVIRVLVALDELGAAILGMPNDVTISSWCGRWREHEGWKRAVALLGYEGLDWLQYGHCEGAIAHDKERSEDALNYLKGS